MKKEKIYKIVYETLDTTNNYIYIGVHKTANLEDGYIGGGIYNQENADKSNRNYKFINAVKKHGYSNFKRKILCIFKTYNAALILERLIVNEDFIKRKDVYNLKIGGTGGFMPMPGEKNGFYGKKHIQETKDMIRKKLEGTHLPQEVKDKIGNKLKGKKKSEEHCLSLKRTCKNKRIEKFTKECFTFCFNILMSAD